MVEGVSGTTDAPSQANEQQLEDTAGALGLSALEVGKSGKQSFDRMTRELESALRGQ